MVSTSVLFLLSLIPQRLLFFFIFFAPPQALSISPLSTKSSSSRRLIVSILSKIWGGSFTCLRLEIIIVWEVIWIFGRIYSWLMEKDSLVWPFFLSLATGFAVGVIQSQAFDRIGAKFILALIRGLVSDLRVVLALIRSIRKRTWNERWMYDILMGTLDWRKVFIILYRWFLVNFLL